MANIAAARIQREFKEVVKSEEVTFGSNTQKTYHFLVFQFEFPKGNNTDSMFPTLFAWKNVRYSGLRTFFQYFFLSGVRFDYLFKNKPKLSQTYDDG